MRDLRFLGICVVIAALIIGAALVFSRRYELTGVDGSQMRFDTVTGGFDLCIFTTGVGMECAPAGPRRPPN